MQETSASIARYELRERLGQSCSGAVYRAWDADLERWVALRLIPPGIAGRGEVRQALIREALTVASLEHPNICPVLDIGETDDGGLFLVSALCEGEPLAQRLLRSPIKVEGAVELTAQIASGVGRAHERGLLHGRLQPGNVWVGADGQVRVVDFGLAGLEERTLRSLSCSEPARKDGLPPEVLLGEALSPRSDVWSIGAMLVAMLGERERLPEDLSRVVSRALSARPSDRQADAGMLRDDLRALRALWTPRESSPTPASREPGRPPELSGVRRLSHYRIGELLGGGGMGVVYKAEDVHLGRTVALKFLPSDMAGNPVAKARFLQEARAASALDHPNICTVYEIGETGDHQLYLAMPCYEGETLRAKTGRGPLPVNEALDYALQVAKGLARAHRQGIVHRDIKPANLMVTTDGLVKILDFGVAKLAGEATLTRTGAAVGTAAYMAPEQIRGEAVNAQADLWSLGVVLYEMVTGRRPFAGDNPEAIRHSVLNKGFEPVARLRPDAPPDLERVVRGLLGKTVADRYPTADAVTADLRGLLGTSSGAAPAPWRRSPSLGRRGRRAAGSILLAAALAGFLLWRFQSREAAPPREAKVTQLTDQQGRELFPSLSPDGSFFVYSRLDGGDQDIFLQRVGGRNPINLTPDSPADDTQPVYSRDGRWIAFRSERDGGGLFVMGATGESVRRLTDLGYQPAWSPDGREIAFATETITNPVARRTTSKLWRVEVGTGRRHLLFQGDGVQPSWSPDGGRIAFWGVRSNGTQRVLYTVPSRGGGSPTVLLDNGSANWNPVWSAEGGLLYFASDRGGSMNVWRIAVDPDSGEARGQPEPVPTPAQSVGPFSLALRDGLILYATDESRADVERLPLDSATGLVTGARVPVTRARGLGTAEPSPDGRWLVLTTKSPTEDLFVVRQDGSDLRQITDDPFRDRQARWSPDGSWIYFQSDRSGRHQIWAVRPDGSGLREVAARADTGLFNPIPSPDGRRLVCSVGFEGAALADLTQAPAARKLIPIQMPGWEPFLFNARSWSPDGGWLAGELGDRKQLVGTGLGVYSFASRRFEKLIPAGHGERIAFLDGNRTLLYLDGNAIRGIDRTTRRTWPVAEARAGSALVNFSVSRDRKTLYLLEGVTEGDIWMLDLGSQARDRAP